MSSGRKQPPKPSEALNSDMGRAPSTKKQDAPAIKLFNYFLCEILCLDPIDEIDIEQLKCEAEELITGYSMYLCNTNIPKSHEKYLKGTVSPAPREFMKYRPCRIPREGNSTIKRACARE